MDYKTNILNNELETKDRLLVEIHGLYFGALGEQKAVFDYTQYFEENEIKPIDYKVFLRYNKHYIETLIKPHNLKTSELVYQNTNGHILIAGELVFLFLAFANPEMLLYFNNLLMEAINDGIAFSNGFICSMATEKIPTAILQDIIRDRENGDTGNE